jgi:hypothetical protein
MVVLVRQRADGLLSAAYGIFPRAASGFLMRKWFAKPHEANKQQVFQMVWGIGQDGRGDKELRLRAHVVPGQSKTVVFLRGFGF